MLIKANDNILQYEGRIDFEDTLNPIFSYVNSNVKLNFVGRNVKIIIKNKKIWNNQYLGYTLDGINGKIILSSDDDEKTYTIADNLDNAEHKLMIYKTHDATNYFHFGGFVLDDDAKVLPVCEKPTRKIEVFGDSVSAGAASECYFREGKPDEPSNGEYCNSLCSYSYMLAQNLNAQLHNNSQGGIALFDNTGYFDLPNTIGLETTFDKMRYFPKSEMTAWDFSKYIPHIVIIAIGQNDSHPDTKAIYDKDYRENWKNKYKEIIKTLKSHYGNPLFILKTTILMHDKIWDDTISEIADEMNDKKIVKFDYSDKIARTSGHIRTSEAYRMTNELTEFINSFGQELWQ